jgi:hypothetical protein
MEAKYVKNHIRPFLLMPLRGFRQNTKLRAAWKKLKKQNAWNLAF